ncbi:DUF4142 domain-containing protein [Mucilaginibacter lacusdianchii]|uniref:DUF4142 domain-containing protein n=1 Tax=Mucilaginibacter lacusdianchii TaxID=2684211 RepID=UPI00131DB6ED|nr:DUF4142 domain-containing protein [Mucilaginibacter sp. JXJ CY 39]
MKKIFYISAIALYTFTAVSCGEKRKSKNYNEKTNVDDMSLEFIKSATEAGLTEISAGKVAQTKSSNAKVVEFAKMMITDHTKSGQELAKIANAKYAPVPNDLLPEHQMKLDSISKLPGPAFDKAYMQMMVMDHEKAVKLYYDIADSKIEAVRGYANKNLPILRTHLEEAKNINASLK